MFVILMPKNQCPIIFDRFLVVPQFEPCPSEPKEGVPPLLEGGEFIDDLLKNLLGLENFSLEIIRPSQEVVDLFNIGAMGVGFDVCLELILRKAVEFIVKGTDGNGQELLSRW